MGCKSYRRGDLVCADGFVQVVACHANESPCKHCGMSQGKLPHCMLDEIPGHMATESGAPLFYRASGEKADG